MSIRSLIVAAAVAVGTFGFADRADAQWRSYRAYTYPTYTYSYPAYSYSPGVVYSSYSYPTYYDSGVVTAGYTPTYSSYYGTPYYSTPYYSTPYYSSSYYTPYYGNFSNVYWNPYGVSVGTQGGAILGRRAWRW